MADLYHIADYFDNVEDIRNRSLGMLHRINLDEVLVCAFLPQADDSISLEYYLEGLTSRPTTSRNNDQLPDDAGEPSRFRTPRVTIGLDLFGGIKLRGVSKSKAKHVKARKLGIKIKRRKLLGGYRLSFQFRDEKVVIYCKSITLGKVVCLDENDKGEFEEAKNLYGGSIKAFNPEQFA
jgi:hypothetical protein